MKRIKTLDDVILQSTNFSRIEADRFKFMLREYLTGKFLPYIISAETHEVLSALEGVFDAILERPDEQGPLEVNKNA